MFDRGKPVVIEGERMIGLNWSNHKLLAHLRAQYRALHYGWILKLYTWVLEIGMVYVLVVREQSRARRVSRPTQLPQRPRLSLHPRQPAAREMLCSDRGEVSARRSSGRSWCWQTRSTASCAHVRVCQPS